MNDIEDAVRIELFIEAAPATVYRFLVDPAKMRQWMGREHRLDPRPGGEFHVHVRNNNVAHGEFREATPDSRVVFTFGWESGGLPDVPAGSTLVEIDLVPQGSGTLLRLTHSGLAGVAAREHTAGWGHYLGRLAVVAQGGAVEPESDH